MDAVWSCFAAQEASQMVPLFQRILEQRQYEYHIKQGSPRYLLDPEHPCTIMIINSPEAFRLSIFHVSNDPLSRLFTRMLISDHRCFRISFLEVRPINKFNKELVSALLRELVRQTDKKPWCIEHPRFKVSWLLNWRNKRKWFRYLSYS